MKITKVIAIIVLIVLVGIQFVPTKRNKSDVTPQTDFMLVSEVPITIPNQLKVSCYDCHSNNTSYPWYNKVQPIAWFLENHIKNGDVFYQTLDSLTGLISSGQMEKEFLLRRGRIVVESDEKYANGISGLLGYAATSESAPAVQQQVTQQQTQKQSEKKKGLLQRIFGF